MTTNSHLGSPMSYYHKLHATHNIPVKDDEVSSSEEASSNSSTRTINNGN